MQGLWGESRVRWLGWAMLGLVCGLGIAVGRSYWLSNFNEVSVGPWQASSSLGSRDAGRLARAGLALNGILALNRHEALYYFAESDSGGRRLSGRCAYRIEGEDPDARWWSLTVYGPDRFLVRNPQHRYSADRNSVTRRDGRRFVVRLDRDLDWVDRDWIALPAGDFFVALRLYNPADDSVNAPQTARLPEIVRERCA